MLRANENYALRELEKAIIMVDDVKKRFDGGLMQLLMLHHR